MDIVINYTKMGFIAEAVSVSMDRPSDLTFQRTSNYFRLTMHVKFSIDIFNMKSNGLDRYVQAIGDEFITESVNQSDYNLFFSFSSRKVGTPSSACQAD